MMGKVSLGIRGNGPPLHGPQKKVECLFCDLCTPCKKPWSCMIIFSMTTYQKKKKKKKKSMASS